MEILMGPGKIICMGPYGPKRQKRTTKSCPAIALKVKDSKILSFIFLFNYAVLILLY